MRCAARRAYRGSHGRLGGDGYGTGTAVEEFGAESTAATQCGEQGRGERQGRIDGDSGRGEENNVWADIYFCYIWRIKKGMSKFYQSNAVPVYSAFLEQENKENINLFSLASLAIRHIDHHLRSVHQPHKVIPSCLTAQHHSASPSSESCRHRALSQQPPPRSTVLAPCPPGAARAAP